jgi:hypothetical protein
MVKSISANIDDLRSLTAKGEGSKSLMRCLVDINEALLSEVIKVLEPFDSATKLLSADHKPTMHLVVATRHKLLSQIATMPTDTEVTMQLKRHLNAQLEKYFTITDFHRIATLLDPRFKLNLTIITHDLRNAAVASLKKMVDETTVSKLVDAILQDEKNTAQPVKKKPKVLIT